MGFIKRGEGHRILTCRFYFFIIFDLRYSLIGAGKISRISGTSAIEENIDEKTSL